MDDPEHQHATESEDVLQHGLHILSEPYRHIAFTDQAGLPNITAGELGTLARLHNNMAHPSNDSLARHLRLDGAKLDLCRWCKQLKCAVCVRVGKPQRQHVVTWRRPTHFNHTVGVDHFFLPGLNGETWHFFHVVDHLTTMQAARLVRTESSVRCAQALEDMWISWAGPPRVVICDAGKGFLG